MLLFSLQTRDTIRVGSTDNSNGGSIVPIKRFIRHEKYNAPITDYDFALLELNEPLNFTNLVQPIALPAANFIIEDGTMCKASGWGELKGEKVRKKPP